jgi:penicillin-binding protein 2
VRIAAFGTIVAAALAVLLLRLWFLQVIGSDKYSALANDNRLRSVVVDAPRGVITDRDGRVLVDNRPAEDLVFRPMEVGSRTTATVLARLAPKLGTTPAALHATIRHSLRTAPYQAVTLAPQVPYAVQQYVLERRDQLPGIGLQQTWLRRYPRDTTLAHALGYVGAIPPSEVKAYQRQGAALDERVGIQGVEAEYQSYLRGIPGRTTVEVDAAGNPVGRQVISSTQPKAGDTLRLSIDLPTQRTLERAIAARAARAGGAGAGVALDPRTGEVLAMASIPSYDPSAYSNGSMKAIQRIARNPLHPLVDRAIDGAYPPGSTFKPIAAIAGLETGFLKPGELIDAPSEIKLYGTTFHGLAPTLGAIPLSEALEFSSDTFFYQLGNRFLSTKKDLLQSWAERFGLGSPSRIDLPGGTASGLVPTAQWKLRNATRLGLEHYWKAADTITMATGQSYLEVTPLQMAVAYSAIFNGGKVVTPQLGERVYDRDGGLVQDLAKGRTTHSVGVNVATLDQVKEGLWLAANGPSGTATPVFANLPPGFRVAGKTGTAENNHGADHSWYVGFAPYDRSHPKKEIVVAVVIENGGLGASAAAPVVCQTMATYLGFNHNRCGSGAGSQSR